MQRLTTIVPTGGDYTGPVRYGAATCNRWTSDTDDFPDTDPIPFWPIDLVPEDDDVTMREALDADRWARLDALAGRVE